MAFCNKILLVAICFLACHSSFAQSRVQQLSAAQYKQNILISFIISRGNACSGYQIQRSSDSINFDVIYDYRGICGELTNPQNISYTDETPLKNAVNYYRVMIPPADYSIIVSVIFSDISEKGYLLYSNPVTQTLQILSSSSNGKLKIYNQRGSFVKEYFPNANGLYREDVSSFTAGLFYFVIENNVGKNSSGKFIKE